MEHARSSSDALHARTRPEAGADTPRTDLGVRRMPPGHFQWRCLLSRGQHWSPRSWWRQPNRGTSCGFSETCAGGQLLFLFEAGAASGGGRLGETLWWSANLAVSANYLFAPGSTPSRLVALALSGYALVVFASLAATLGAFFVEQRAEQASAEEA